MDERLLILRSQEPEPRSQEAEMSWVEAVRWGRLSNGIYETHGTYGSCLMSPVGRVTTIRPSARLRPMSIAASWLLAPYVRRNDTITVCKMIS
jgi:hypothetical protein